VVKRDKAYIMAFAGPGDCVMVYDVHITDDLETGGTWEYVEHAFSAPGAELMFVWRRDDKKFTKKESDRVTKYVRDDLKEFMDEGKSDGPAWHNRILKKLACDDSCLILCWDKFKLPGFYGRWDEAAYDAYDTAMDEVERISKGKSLHDKKLGIYEGGNPYMPEPTEHK